MLNPAGFCDCSAGCAFVQNFLTEAEKNATAIYDNVEMVTMRSYTGVMTPINGEGPIMTPSLLQNSLQVSSTSNNQLVTKLPSSYIFCLVLIVLQMYAINAVSSLHWLTFLEMSRFSHHHVNCIFSIFSGCKKLFFFEKILLILWFIIIWSKLFKRLMIFNFHHSYSITYTYCYWYWIFL